MKFGAMLVVMLGVSLGARADTNYGVGGVVDGFSGTGTLYVQSNGLAGGSYTIQRVTGPGVTGLLTPMSFHNNDNQFFPSGSPLLDESGFAFTDSMDGVDYTVNIFDSGSSYGAFVDGTDGTDLEAVDAQFMLTGNNSQNAALRAVLLRDDALSSGNLQAYSFRFAASTIAAATNATTPEPGSFVLMGTGLLGAAAMVRRRARK